MLQKCYAFLKFDEAGVMVDKQQEHETMYILLCTLQLLLVKVGTFSMCF